ncbi:hypothetical protein Tco_1176751 [Tanacetum coccineum]
MEECHLLLTDQVDLVNLEGHRVVPDVSKPLPLGGPPGQVTIQIQYFFNKDLEYLVSGNKGRRSALSISKLKAAQYLDFGLEELEYRLLWIESGDGRRTPATEEASTGPSTQPQDDASPNIVHDSPSPANAKTGADTDKTNSGDQEEKTTELNEGQAGLDPGKTPESRPPPDDDKMDEDQAGPDPGEIRVALAGPNPEPTHEEFMANVYPNVHESLKFLADEHVILEDPLSSFRNLSSMKNLDDAYTIGDQFLNDKSIEDELGKLNVEAKVVFMVTVPIYQASSSVLPLSTSVIGLSPLKLLAAHVTALQKKFSDFEQKSNTLDNTTQNLRSRVFTLKLRDLPHKINQTVNEVVKEAVHRSLPEHVALYEALKAYMKLGNMDEFLAKMDKSCKRRHDNQVPPPPLPDSDLSKKKRHDSDASGSTQPPAPQSST